MAAPALKPVFWIGSSRRDLKGFPEPVQKKVGDALQEAQYGLKPYAAKPLVGFGGANVLEIRADNATDTYRAVYTVRFSEHVYVLHAFQKKSRHGIQTPKQDIETIRARLRAAEAFHAELIRSSQKEA